MMTLTSTRFLHFAALCGLGIVLLSACTPTDTPSESPKGRREDVEAYMQANITRLSPEPAVLGGTFYVTQIEWIDDDSLRVSYEDGHIALVGTTDVSLEGGVISAETITLEQQDE